MVSNHLSHLDVFVLGLPLPRMLNYVARSTLFVPVVGTFIRSVGGFPIQRDGKGSQGFRETLRRVRDGNIVTFFPEGTRTEDGELGELKPGHRRAGVASGGARSSRRPSPARSRPGPAAEPSPAPTRSASTTDGPSCPRKSPGKAPEVVTQLIREHLLESQAIARAGLRGDLGE